MSNVSPTFLLDSNWSTSAESSTESGQEGRFGNLKGSLLSWNGSVEKFRKTPTAKVLFGTMLVFLIGSQILVIIFSVLMPWLGTKERFLTSTQFDPSQAWVDEYWTKVRMGGWTWNLGGVVVAQIFYLFHSSRKQVTFKSFSAKSFEVYFLWTWTIMVLEAASLTVFWYLSDVERMYACFFVGICDASCTYYFNGIIEKRMRFIECAWGRGVGSHVIFIIRHLNWVLMATVQFIATWNCLPARHHGKFKCLEVAGSGHFWGAYNFIQSATSLIIGATLWTAIGTVREPTLTYSSCVGCYAKLEQKWARKYLSFQRRAMSIPLVVNACSLAFNGFMFNFIWAFKYSMVMDALTRTFSTILEVITLVFLVGIWKEQRPEISIDARPMNKVSFDQPRSEVWNSKVREMAGRYITAGELLEFYCRLGPSGDVMPHFDPLCSKTADVVRQAVIPLSRCGSKGRAYVDAAGIEKAHYLAERMVTHAWDNLFLHLVSAVIADAMNLKDYAQVAHSLVGSNVGLVYERLLLESTQDQRYWICAFCVNQHAGICGGFGEPPRDTQEFKKWDSKRRDAVTCMCFPICDCTEPKFFNDAIDLCEMNKFDAMMYQLREEVPEFTQVVVVDPDFVIFSRAWCVAELVEASLSGLQQHVQLFTHKLLDITASDLKAYKKLARLTVAECEASRPEDKQAILNRIPNIQDFDTHLQTLIFGKQGLLQRHFHGFGLLDAAVRTARRCAAIHADPANALD